MVLIWEALTSLLSVHNLSIVTQDLRPLHRFIVRQGLMTFEGLYKSSGDDLPTWAPFMLEVVGKHPLDHQSGENLHVPGGVGTVPFPPVFLSLNLVYDIALGDSVRLEVFSRQGHWLRKVR